MIFVLLLGLAAPVRGQEMTPEKILSFADHLFDQADYYRAITEYERLIFFYPDHPLARTAKYQIALSYSKGDKFDQAIQRFRTLSDEYPNEETGKEALFMLGETYYRKKDYAQAIDVLERFQAIYPADARRDSAMIRIGWSYLRQGDWRQASEEFQKVPADSAVRPHAEGLAADVKAFPEIPNKSPYLAAGLSTVLPGAGQLYVGRPVDAAVSFMLNGLFIWATVEAFQNNNNVTGAILLFFESGWYLGNIYNAASSAHKYNHRAEQDFLDRLSNQYSVSYIRDGQGNSVLAITMRF
jgi:tetratricopeptide (TPR) repeat protein